MDIGQAKHLSEVLAAYSEGKTIQVRFFHLNEGWTEWEDYKGIYAFSSMSDIDWRIKPMPKIRPYNNANEFFKAQKKHGPYIVRYSDTDKYYECPKKVYDSKVVWGHYQGKEIRNTFEELTQLEWIDGTPCGVVEE